MADNDKSKIRYDDFISNVQPDPAKPESTIMLSGYVGHGPEGHARIYPDPTLGSWYDVPEDDVVYSTPIADSKLGGSHVWVRATAQIKPGSTAPAAPEAVQPQQAAAVGNPTPATHCFVCDPPKAAQAVQPTPTVQTHCFICPPHNTAATICTMPPACPPRTHAIHCPSNPVVCDTLMPTPATRCFICPPPDQTLATICTQIGVGCPPHHTHQIFCPTQPVVCNLQPTQPVVCGVLPPSFGCQQGGGQGAQPEAVHAAALHPTPSAVHQCGGQVNTAATICTQVPHCPPHTIHNSMCICPTPSAFHPCGHNTAATVCTVGPPCPPHTVHNTMCICPTPSAVHQCGGPPNTAATVCTQVPHCPPHTVHNSMCICPTPSAVHQCGGQTPFTPTIPQFTVVGACPTFGACPSIACGFTPVQNGVFTPFGR